MQAVILAAGNSSRFIPFNSQHKSLITICGKTIVEHTINSIKSTGIHDVIIVCKDPQPFKNIVGDGSSIDMNIRYCVQSDAQGMGDALLQATEYLHGDFFVLSAHRVDFADNYHEMKEKKSSDVSGVLLVQRTDDISQYGSAVLKDDKVTDLIEKPEQSDGVDGYRVLSTYLLTPEFLNVLKTTPLEHYHFETALSQFCTSHDVRAIHVEQESFSLKYSWDLLDIKNYLLSKISAKRGNNVQVADTAKIYGEVEIGDNVQIMEYAVIKGPAFIGNNSIIGDFTVLRNGAVVEEGGIIGGRSEVKNSHIQAGTHIHAGYIGDSVLGKNCRIGAGFCTSNARLDRNSISVLVNEKKINTGKKSLGVIMGDNVRTGIYSSTMPGVIVGNEANIGPSTTIMGNVDDNTTIYSEFSYVTKKNNS